MWKRSIFQRRGCIAPFSHPSCWTPGVAPVVAVAWLSTSDFIDPSFPNKESLEISTTIRGQASFTIELWELFQARACLWRCCAQWPCFELGRCGWACLSTPKRKYIEQKVGCAAGKRWKGIEVLRYMRSQGMYEKTANVFRSSFSMEARRVFSIPISLV